MSFKTMRKLTILQQYRERTHFISRQEFGGLLLRNSHPKTKRPYSQKHLMHFVITTKKKKFGGKFLIAKNRLFILQKMKSLQKLFTIKIQQIKIEEGIIQYVCRCRNRTQLANFNRALSGIIVRKMTGVEKGCSQLKESFFSQRPFSRIIESQKKYFVMSQHQVNALILAEYIPATFSKHFYSSA